MFAFPYPNAPKVLHLTLKKEWFDLILAGEKKEEYREAKEYWNKRFIGKDFDFVCMRNGYSKDARVMLLEVKEKVLGLGRQEWGAPRHETVWILRLGKIKYTRNIL